MKNYFKFFVELISTAKNDTELKRGFFGAVIVFEILAFMASSLSAFVNFMEVGTFNFIATFLKWNVRIFIYLVIIFSIIYVINYIRENRK